MTVASIGDKIEIKKTHGTHFTVGKQYEVIDIGSYDVPVVIDNDGDVLHVGVSEYNVVEKEAEEVKDMFNKTDYIAETEVDLLWFMGQLTEAGYKWQSGSEPREFASDLVSYDFLPVAITLDSDKKLISYGGVRSNQAENATHLPTVMKVFGGNSAIPEKEADKLSGDFLVETEEEYEWLMDKLAEQNAKWAGGEQALMFNALEHVVTPFTVTVDPAIRIKLIITPDNPTLVSELMDKEKEQDRLEVTFEEAMAHLKKDYTNRVIVEYWGEEQEITSLSDFDDLDSPIQNFDDLFNATYYILN